MAQEAPTGEKQIYLELNNASWHKSKILNWHHIRPLYLPPYSPDYNPIERLWQHLKSNYLAGYLTRKGEELCQRLFDSLRDMMSDAKKNRFAHQKLFDHERTFEKWSRIRQQ